MGADLLPLAKSESRSCRTAKPITYVSHLIRCHAKLLKGKRPEQPVSRILFPVRVTPKRTTTIHLWMQIALHLLRPTRELGRAALRHSPIWSCTGWGLQSFPGHPENWCALTAPFHPYPAINAGRYIFCCTFLRVATTPRYGAPCPAVFGLSSGSGSDPAIV